MNVVKKFIWPLLMLGLLACAIVLPRFVQKSQKKPTPPQDLAAALAAVKLPESEESEEPVEGMETPELPAEYRENPQFAPFLQALREQDFELARTQLVELSPTLDEDAMRTLTDEMERSVSRMSIMAVTKTMDDPAGPSGDDVPTDFATEPEPVEAPPIKKEVDVRPFFTALRKENFATAEQFISSHQEDLSESMAISLEESLRSAAEAAEELAASKAKLSESEKQFASLQSSGVADIKSSVQELVSATETAKIAADEASQLRKEIAEMKKIVDQNAAKQSTIAKTSAAATPAEPAAKKKVIAKKDLPANVVIPFGFDSSYLTTAEKEKLSKVVAALKKESALAIQLRGFADRDGDSAYNAILGKARCEVVKDFLTESGVEDSRIGLISFGETMNEPGDETNTVPRRVEVRFRSAN